MTTVTKEIICYTKGKGIKAVSRLPNLIMKQKGNFDAKKGSSVADAYVSKLLHSADALINKETLKAEKLLFPFREEAATIISSLCITTEALKAAPVSINGNSAQDVRANKKASTVRKEYVAALRSDNSRLASINEIIISVTTAQEQRIEKTKKLCMGKIAVYEAGIREGGLSDYKATIKFDNLPVQKYIANHETLDKRVATLTGSIKEAE